MMRKSWMGWFVVVALVSGAGFAACTTDSSSKSDDDDDDGSGGGTSSSGGTTTSTTTNTTAPAPVAPPDAGPDEVPDCASLDPTKPVVLYLSADDSNSMASPAKARAMLNDGYAPQGAEGIRTYEFLNYYNIHYPAPPAGDLSVISQMQAAVDPGAYELQLAVRSFDAVVPRRPMTITFVLDTSGSMGGEGIDRTRDVIEAMAASLTDGDIVNMVTWSTNNNVVLNGWVVSGPNDPTLIAAAPSGGSGGTDLHSGLVKGYELANQYYGSHRLNRLVLVSDGGANVGVTDADLIATHSDDGDKEGIYLVGIGVGNAGGYNDGLMDSVTDAGRGAYVFIDSAAEAQAIFVERFDEVMEVAARGVQVELTLPWYFEMRAFYGEEYSENPQEVKPQHLAPSDAQIFYQVLQACDEAVVDLQDAVTVTATWQEPLTYVSRETSTTATLSELLAGETAQLRKGAAIVKFAEALKTGDADDLVAAHTAANAAGATSGDLQLTEVVALIEKHPSYP